MSSKILSMVLCLIVSTTFSFSWSSNINTLFKSKSIFPMNANFHPTTIETIAIGAQMAMKECRNVFKWERWNCPQSSFTRQSMRLATRENAFVEAIIAAGVVHSLTRNCSRGEILNCGCHPELVGTNNVTILQMLKIPTTIGEDNKKKLTDWSWGGCSDDTRYAEHIVLRYLDAYDDHQDAQAFVSRHNNRIGREIIRQTMVRKCRCHGVSGSCTLQTCWMQVADFSKAAKELYNYYEDAVRISFDGEEGDLSVGNSARQPILDAPSESLSNALIYLEESPDYCISNNYTGRTGTKGRICSRSNSNAAKDAERRNCRNLCTNCGYKIKKQKKSVSFRCNCRFVWCCEVKCDICTKYVQEHSCES